MTPLFTTEKVTFQDKIQYPDIEIQPLTPAFVVGKNGSGKSTLFKMFNRTLAPTDGRIIYNGRDLSEFAPLSIRKEVLLVSQQVFLFDDTIRGNFKKYYQAAKLAEPSDDDIKAYLSLTNAEFDLNSATRTMSGGERQRVYLALYLSFKPKVLLLDEPTAALDKESSIDIMAQVLDFCETHYITGVVISHDENLVSLFARQIVRLS